MPNSVFCGKDLSSLIALFTIQYSNAKKPVDNYEINERRIAAVIHFVIISTIRTVASKINRHCLFLFPASNAARQSRRSIPLIG